MKYNICILGGGNIGTALYVELINKGYDVSLYTRDLSKWNDIITLYDKDREKYFYADNKNITDNIELALKDKNLIISTIPAEGVNDTFSKIKYFINKDCDILFYPGFGGVEFATQELLDKGCTIYGIQRVGFISRLNEYGKKVTKSGEKKEVLLGSIPKDKAINGAKIFEELFNINTISLPNYLCVTLTPSNPILHTSRLYNLFRNYNKDIYYDNVPLFYGNWDDASSHTLINCDNELHGLLKEINDFDLSSIKPLLQHYDSYDVESLTKKLTSISSLSKIASPIKIINNKYVPDLDSRYFATDFPYGLLIIKYIALIFNYKTPSIDNVIYWYQNIVNKKYIDQFGMMDIDFKKLYYTKIFKNKDELIHFYQR